MIRGIPLSTLNNTDSKILESNDSYLTKTPLFGSTSFDSETNTLVLNATIIFCPLKDSKNLFFQKALFFHMQFI